MTQSSTWETVKKRLCQVFSPLTTKKCAATKIHCRPQAVEETLQRYIQRFTDLVIQVMGTNSIAVTCWVTTVLFIRHLFNNELRKQVAGV